MIKLIERLLHSEVNFASTRAVLIAGDTWPLAAQLANPVKNRRRTSDHSTALPQFAETILVSVTVWTKVYPVIFVLGSAGQSI